jgi:hypothetical protein
MKQNDEDKPAPVAATSKQAGEARDPWWWVERTVWTERMLTRLTTDEPANRVWFTLVEKTYAPANLRSAFNKVWRNGGSAGTDAQTVAHFGRTINCETTQTGQCAGELVSRNHLDCESSTTTRAPRGETR